MRLTGFEVIGDRKSEAAYHSKGNLRSSHWVRFQEAAKAHQEVALRILRAVFDEIEFTRMRNY